jgi:ketosteroid isomerase-like protein
MKNFPLCLGLFIALIATQCTQPAETAVDNSATIEALKALDLKWSEDASSAESHASYYAEDATVLAPNETLMTGRAAIAEELKGYYAMSGFDVTWKPTHADASGDLGYTIGTYEMTMNDSTGNPTKDVGKYLVVWKKQTDGSWKVASEAFSSDQPMEH